ncbi:MAG: hypothetical protein V7K46_10925, partial [Nostoc sp.]
MVVGADAVCFGLDSKGVIKGAIFSNGAGDGVVVGATAIFLKLGTFTVVVGADAVCFGLDSKGVIKGAIFSNG